MNKNLFFKICVSVFLVYHLSAIIVMPNQSSFVGRTLSPYFSKYSNQLGLSYDWSFFAPEPTDPLHLKVGFIDFGSRDTVWNMQVPPLGPQFDINPNSRRKTEQVRRMLMDVSLLKEFARHLCLKRRSTKYVVIATFAEKIALFDHFLLLGQDLAPNQTVETQPERTFDCESLISSQGEDEEFFE